MIAETDEMGTPRRPPPTPTRLCTMLTELHGVDPVELTAVEEVFRTYRGLKGRALWYALHCVARIVTGGGLLFFRWPRYGTHPYSIGLLFPNPTPDKQ